MRMFRAEAAPGCWELCEETKELACMLFAGTQQGFELLTVDHGTGRLRVDLEGAWDGAEPPVPRLPPDDQLCDSEVQNVTSFPPLRSCRHCDELRKMAARDSKRSEQSEPWMHTTDLETSEGPRGLETKHGCVPAGGGCVALWCGRHARE